MPPVGTRIRVEVPLDGPIIYHRVADAVGPIPVH
jgi:hypothetical protein